MKRPNVLMTGPLPPAVGGMASVISSLQASSLVRHVNLQLFETGKTTKVGRPIWLGISSRFRVIWRWWRLLSRRERVLAHIHTCSGLTYFLDGVLLIMARIRGAPTVLHIHGGRFDAFLDGLGPFRRQIAQWLARRAHLVIVLSVEWQDRLCSRLPGARIVVVPNGVNILPASARQCQTAPVRFVFVGSVSRAKGIHCLLRATELAMQPWTVDLIGPEGEQGFLAWLKSEILSRGLSERINILGLIVGEERDRLLDSADGFVLPSLTEALPMAMLEAMAAGLPVVATKVGSIPEVIRDGFEGRLVNPEDPVALARALDELAGDESARLKMGEIARETCARHYGMETMAERILKIYRQLVFEGA